MSVYAKAIADLLRRVPNDWAEVPEDAQGDALAALTAAGFVAHRITFTVRMPGSDETNRVTIEMTGEYGFVEAMEAAAQDWWVRYGQRWRELRQDIGEPVRPIITRRRDEWKLTSDGRVAREDLERGLSTPIDFALKRGFFDGRPRVLTDGRVTQRLPVRGYGRLVSLENAPRDPLAVDIAKFSAADELAEALAKAFATIQSTARGDSKDDGLSDRASGVTATPTGFLSAAEIADILHVHPTQREAFIRQLGRMRISLGDENWQETQNPRANTPRFLYRADCPRLREIASKYQSPKRP